MGVVAMISLIETAMATTQNDVRNAQADYRLKVRMERRLSRKMVGQFNAIAKETKKNYITNKNILWVAAFMPAFLFMIEDHYLKVARIFAKRVNTGDILLTDEEFDLLRRTIQIAAKNNANVSAKEILDTAQKEINDSFGEAQLEALNKQKVLSTRKLASIASAKFKQKSMARAKTTIPITQTQQAAEKTKFNVVNAHHTSVKKPVKAIGIKTWHTVGDEKVRIAHRAANFQTQLLSLPFDVGGEELMQPGDSSLGATAGNTINCRCSAQYSFRK